MVSNGVGAEGPRHTMESSFVTCEHACLVLLVGVIGMSLMNAGFLEHLFSVGLGLCRGMGVYVQTRGKTASP